MLDNLKGELRVFTRKVKINVKGEEKEKVIFNACVGYTKNDDNTYTNYYMLVNFSNDVKKEVKKVYQNESFDILLKDGWIKAYKDKDDHTQPILFVNKASVILDDTKTKAKKEKIAPVEDDDLPF